MSSPILSATVEKKVLNFSETSHVSWGVEKNFEFQHITSDQIEKNYR
jgi:hypothetical protein